jgi:predicted AlkP superfamily phosphohydrolase/phosphomutase
MDGDTLLVFGIDGADWAYVDPLIARGLMPNLARLRAEGAWGPLQSMTPTDSPVIWTTIATGQPPRRHGVRGFTLSRMRGVQTPLRRVKPVRLLGYESLEEWLEGRGILFDAPVSSLVRREPALWNLMSDAGRPVTVLNWWATWPAEPVVGRMVSERVYYWRWKDRGFRPEKDQLTHPPELHATIAGDLVPPDAVSYEQARAFVDVDRAEFDRMMATPFSKRLLESELRYFLSMYETNLRVARRLVRLDREQYGRPADLLVLERLVDMACHAALAESELVRDHLGADAERQRKFGRVVTAAYAAVDRQLGELLEAYGDGNVVVLSDHGFHLVPQRRNYGHGDAPAGLFVAHGPAFRPGRLAGLSVRDVFPLLARIRSLPLADDLAGRLPEEALSTSARAMPVERVARYGAHATPTSGESGAYDQEMLERLRALGYVQ